MLKTILRTPRFKRDYKTILRKHFDERHFVEAISALMSENRQLLITQFKDHALQGAWQGFRELHIEGDWLLVYRINRKELELVLVRTGTHDDLF